MVLEQVPVPAVLGAKIKTFQSMASLHMQNTSNDMMLRPRCFLFN